MTVGQPGEQYIPPPSPRISANHCAPPLPSPFHPLARVSDAVYLVQANRGDERETAAAAEGVPKVLWPTSV